VRSNETASFLVPSGGYSVTGTQGGVTTSAVANMTAGFAKAVTLNFIAAVAPSSGSSIPSYEIILIVTAAAAGIANVANWFLRSRSLRARMASASEGS